MNDITNQNNDIRNSDNQNIEIQNINDDNLIDLIVDDFKVALNLVPRRFESFTIGEMNLICQSCDAKHFSSEITAGDRNNFTQCCHIGKVSLPPLSQNIFFNTLYHNLSSNNSVYDSS